MATKIAYVRREWPADMLGGLADGLVDDLRDKGVGRVMTAELTIDPGFGRAFVGLVGEVCEGEVALRIFAGGHSIQESINSWIEENGVEDLVVKLARADGRDYILVAGSKRGFA